MKTLDLWMCLGTLYLIETVFGTIVEKHTESIPLPAKESVTTTIPLYNTTVYSVNTDNSTSAAKTPLNPRKICAFKPGKKFSNRALELKCCKYITNRYYRRWFNGGEYLTTFLTTLDEWDCPQLSEECKNRYFAYTPFASTVYMKICEPEVYRDHCKSEIVRVVLTTPGKPRSTLSQPFTTNLTWENVISRVNSANMTDDEIQQPCIQVAMYEGPRGGYGRFHEVMDIIIPFCGFVWCGFDADVIDARSVSVWTCLPTRCRAGVVISIVVIACFGIAIIMANLTVIIVYSTNKRMKNSQSVYKITLAIGDTLVGVVVFPTFISSMYMMYVTPQKMGDVLSWQPNSTDEIGLLPQMRAPGKHFRQNFSREYLDLVGFFTSLSLVLSVYTLMLASFDRMSAVSRPLKYRKGIAFQLAKYSCIALVFLGLLLAALPIFVPSLRYGLVASLLVSLYGADAVILYTVAFLIPLVIVWGTTITICVYSKRHSRVRRRLSVTPQSNIEARLARTLGIMVGVFTASLLPAVATLISSFLLSDIYYNRPEYLRQTSATSYVSIEFVSISILMTNSLWNCVIYSTRHSDFRKAALEIYTAASQSIGSSAMFRRVRRLSEKKYTTSSSSQNITNSTSAQSAKSSESSRAGTSSRKPFTTSSLTFPSNEQNAAATSDKSYNHHAELPATSSVSDKQYCSVKESIDSDINF